MQGEASLSTHVLDDVITIDRIKNLLDCIKSMKILGNQKCVVEKKSKIFRHNYKQNIDSQNSDWYVFVLQQYFLCTPPCSFASSMRY